MKRLILTIATMMICVLTFAQSGDIAGKWTTVDDETKQAKSIVEIFKTKDGKYNGRIVKLLQKPENENCVNCKDDRKNKPLVGLEIIRGLKLDGGEFTGGTITDPKTGKTYKCTITRRGDQLDVRGYVGFSLIGRTQVWKIAK